MNSPDTSEGMEIRIEAVKLAVRYGVSIALHHAQSACCGATTISIVVTINTILAFSVLSLFLSWLWLVKARSRWHPVVAWDLATQMISLRRTVGGYLNHLNRGLNHGTPLGKISLPAPALFQFGGVQKKSKDLIVVSRRSIVDRRWLIVYTMIIVISLVVFVSYIMTVSKATFPSMKCAAYLPSAA